MLALALALATTTSVCSIVELVDQGKRTPLARSPVHLTVPMSSHEADATTDADGRACFDVPMPQKWIYTIVRVKKEPGGLQTPQVEVCAGEQTPPVHFTLYTPAENVIADCFYPNGDIPTDFHLE